MFCRSKNLRLSRERERGFTLIEAVLASAILALITGGIITLLNITMRSGATVETRIQAQYLLQEAFERARNIRDTKWIDGALNSWDEGLSNNSVTLNLGNKVYSVKTEILPVDNDKDKKRVKVTVFDKNGSEIMRSSTILTNWIMP